MEDFRYSPLDTNHDTFRLLRISADLECNYINCELKHATTFERYRALSYTWGSASDQETLIVNGKRLQIRRNLANFLRIARRTYPEQWFWIDAICIDQSNIEERNHHVREMAKIYKRSFETVLWLGIPSAQMERLDSAQEVPVPYSLEDVFVRYGCKKSGRSPETLDFWDLFEKDRNFFLLTSLLLQWIYSHPYWRRLWVVQEVVLSSRKVLLTQHFSVQWEFLTKMFRWGSSWYSGIEASRFRLPVIRRSALAKQQKCLQSKLSLSSEAKPPIPSRSVSAMYLWFVWKTGRRGRDFAIREEVNRLCTMFLHGPAAHLTDNESVLNQRLAGTSKSPLQVQTLQPRKANEGDHWFLVELLSFFASAKCSDPRDMIYGLLALTPFIDTFPIDYGLDVYDLYFRTFRFLHSSQHVQANAQDVVLILRNQLRLGIMDLAYGDPKHRSCVKFIDNVLYVPSPIPRTVLIQIEKNEPQIGKSHVLGRSIVYDHPVHIILGICDHCQKLVSFETSSPSLLGFSLIECHRDLAMSEHFLTYRTQYLPGHATVRALNSIPADYMMKWSASMARWEKRSAKPLSLRHQLVDLIHLQQTFAERDPPQDTRFNYLRRTSSESSRTVQSLYNVIQAKGPCELPITNSMLVALRLEVGTIARLSLALQTCGYEVLIDAADVTNENEEPESSQSNYPTYKNSNAVRPLRDLRSPPAVMITMGAAVRTRSRIPLRFASLGRRDQGPLWMEGTKPAIVSPQRAWSLRSASSSSSMAVR